MKLLRLIILIAAAIPTLSLASEYKSLECEVSGAGKNEPVTLTGRQIPMTAEPDGTYLSIAEDEVSGVGTVHISQMEYRPDVLNLFVKTSDIIGIRVQSSIVMNEIGDRAVGYFTLGSEVHETIIITCTMLR